MRRGHGDKQLVQTGVLMGYYQDKQGYWRGREYIDLYYNTRRPSQMTYDRYMVANIYEQYRSLPENDAWSRAKLHFTRLNRYGSYENYLGYVVIEKRTGWSAGWLYTWGLVYVWPSTYSSDASAWCGICDCFDGFSYDYDNTDYECTGSGYYYRTIETYMNPNAGTIDAWGNPCPFGIVHREPYTPGTTLRVTGELYAYI